LSWLHFLSCSRGELKTIVCWSNSRIPDSFYTPLGAKVFAFEDTISTIHPVSSWQVSHWAPPVQRRSRK
jgi:hypothetical protein